LFITAKTSFTVNSDFIQAAILDTASPATYEVFKITTTAARPFVEEAEKLVAWLNTAYHIRINSIILDFIKDHDGSIWITGCKKLEIEPSTLHYVKDESEYEQFIQKNMWPKYWELRDRVTTIDEERRVRNMWVEEHKAFRDAKRAELSNFVRCSL
jgi:hypothetical protein